MAIITISRGTYSGGLMIAECLGKALGYRLLSREELLEGAAREYEASKSQLADALQQKPGFLQRGRLTKLHYVYCVQAALAKQVRNDNVVYHGYAGHLLLQGIPHHMRLKVVSDMDYLERAAMKRGNMSEDDARARIAELDRTRDEWVDWVYGADRNDPATYDLVVNLERIAPKSVCTLVVDTVKRDFVTTPESQRAIDNLVFTSDIEAQIGLDSEINCDRIEVSMDAGVVTISGTVGSLHDADRIRNLVRKKPEVKDIVSKMATRWH
jgi:cytidylate kinase